MQTYPECSNHDGDERSGADTTDVVKQLMDRLLTHPLQVLHQLYGHQPPKHTHLYSLMATSPLNTHTVYTISWPQAP